MNYFLNFKFRTNCLDFEQVRFGSFDINFRFLEHGNICQSVVSKIILWIFSNKLIAFCFIPWLEISRNGIRFLLRSRRVFFYFYFKLIIFKIINFINNLNSFITIRRRCCFTILCRYYIIRLIFPIWITWFVHFRFCIRIRSSFFGVRLGVYRIRRNELFLDF